MDINKYISEYFHKTKKILETKNPDNIITLQFFQRRDNAMLAGMEEALDFLEKHTDTSKYKIRYLKDGTIMSKMEVALELTGRYQDFEYLWRHYWWHFNSEAHQLQLMHMNVLKQPMVRKLYLWAIELIIT